MRALPMVGGMRATVLRALSRSDLFEGLSELQLDQVADRAELLQLASGEAVVMQGDASQSFFVVLNGVARVIVASGTEAAEVSRLGPSDTVGEQGLLLGTPRTATVLAEGPLLVLRFDDVVFDAMFQKIPGFGMAICRALARRLADATSKIAQGR